MKLKPLAITVLIVSTLALLSFWQQQASMRTNAFERGDTFIAESLLKNLDRIEINSGEDNSLVIAKEGESWVLRSHHEIPVSFDTVNSYVQSLLEMSAFRFVTDSSEYDERLSFEGNRISLYAGKRLLWLAEIGKQSNLGSNFIKLEQSGEIYLTRDQVVIKADMMKWIDERLLSLESKEVQFVSFPIIGGDDKIRLSFTRDTPDDEFAAPVPLLKQADSDKVKIMVRQLSQPRFSGFLEQPEEYVTHSKVNSHTVVLKTFDGRRIVYHLSRGTLEPTSVVDEGADVQQTSSRLLNGPVMIHLENPPAGWETAQENEILLTSPELWERLQSPEANFYMDEPESEFKFPYLDPRRRPAYMW